MFGERLKTIRKESKLTQQELSVILRVSASTIGMYEQDRRDPDTSTVVKVAQYFDVSADWLLGLSEIRTPAGRERHYIDVSGLTEEEIGKVEEYANLLRNSYVPSESKSREHKKASKNPLQSE